jgi:outer membrane protein insertion porin family
LSRLAIRKLFKTGFFRDVRLEREGNILVVQVVERPTITKISIDGSKEISEKDLIETMKGLGLAEGRVFNRSLLDKVERELKKTYYNVGKYSARIKTTVTPLERNRISLQLDISEGKKSAIVGIHLVGNEKFKDKKLRKGFKQKTKSSFGIFKSRYQYSKQKLVGDIERLRNFYQNRGFMKFNVESTQVSITPDKENVFVTINISEGKKYTISGINIAGKLVLPEADIRKLITIKPGDVFSRKIITRIQKNINDAHGDIGYAFTKISIAPKIDDATATVSFTFNIDPGQRVYIRRINFSGNTITSDLVLRREMRQLEGAWLSRKKLERSRVRLQRLGFFDSVRIKTERVAGTTDQMDITFVVKERQTGNINLALGYSDVDGAIITAGITQSNLFGTGKNLNVSINRSDSTKSANFGPQLIIQKLLVLGCFTEFRYPRTEG